MTEAIYPEKAFILAAGMGSRLRPYTDHMPKPMVPIAGKSIIQRTLEKLAAANVKEVVVNTHYLAPVLEDHLSSIGHPAITISKEEGLLDTGGGVKAMIHVFGGKPFYIINGDALWEDKGNSALSRLSNHWNDGGMDILLLLQPTDAMSLTGSVGDYILHPDGRAERSGNRTGTHMFAGVRIAHPRIFGGIAKEVFSFLELMDKAEQNARLFGVEHAGEWHHISTPDDYRAVDARFAVQERAG